MKYYKSIFLVLFCFLLISCKNNKVEKEADSLLLRARVLAKEGLYDQSEDLLDSLSNNYPNGLWQKTMAERLQDTISKIRSQLMLDSLYNLQNEYRCQLYSPNLSSEDKEYIQSLIDSLDNEKQPFRGIIRGIEAKEGLRNASCQCVTMMRSR